MAARSTHDYRLHRYALTQMLFEGPRHCIRMSCFNHPIQLCAWVQGIDKAPMRENKGK